MFSNQSLLITGGSVEARANTANEIAAEHSDKFDLKVIWTEENHGIEAVREILQSLSRKPFQSRLNTVIILEADNLTIEAQNALLKALEEPPEHSQIILTAKSRDKLLPTITSRCLEKTLAREVVVNRNDSLAEFLDFGFSQQLEELEKISLEEYLDWWREALLAKISGKEGSLNLKRLWNYNKLIIKLKKGSKLSLNKKLISLILALELPTEG